MKYLKTYEIYIDKKNADENSDLLRKYKYKIGDIVRLHRQVFEIDAINTNDVYQPYKLKDKYGEYWMDDKYFKQPTEEELEEFLMKKDANKYNL